LQTVPARETHGGNTIEKLITTLLLMLPAMAGAQNYQNMGEADMQKMMQQMQKMQACMAEIDLSEMEEFEQRANQMQAKVDALCASGKRDEAQEEGIAFAREVSSNESMKKMQTCSKMMQGAMPGMPTTRQEAADMVGNRHICDN
jgi:Skp family chaperone for outer membrane proteins